VDAWKNYAGLSGGGMTRADTSRVERKKREDIVSEDSSEDGSSSSDSGPPEIVGQSSQIEDGGEETKVDGKEPNSDGKPRSSKKITSKTTGDLPELHILAKTQTKNQMSKKQRAQPAESGMQHPIEPYYPGYPPPMMPHSAYYDPRFYRYPPPMHPPYYDPYYHGYSHYGGYNDPHMNHGQQPPGYAGADWQKQAWPNPQNPNVAHGANPMQSSTQPMGNGVPEPPAKAKKKKNRRGKHKPKNKAKDVTGEIDTEPKSNEG
jgi:hypothetical protein